MHRARLSSAPLYVGGAGSRAPSVGLLFRFVAQRRHRVHSSVTEATHHRISLYNDRCGCEARVFNGRRVGWIGFVFLVDSGSRSRCTSARACVCVWLRTSQRKQSLICTLSGPLYVTSSDMNPQSHSPTHLFTLHRPTYTISFLYRGC